MMHALRGHLGSARVDRALRRLLDERGGPLRTASVLDLRDQLLAESPTAEGSAAVTEWFEARVTWDLRVDSAIVLAREGAGTKLRLQVSGERWDGTGVAPNDDVVEVAVEDAKGTIVWREAVQLTGGVAARTITFDEVPAVVVVDPSSRVIDRDRGNNRVEVTEQGMPSR